MALDLRGARVASRPLPSGRLRVTKLDALGRLYRDGRRSVRTAGWTKQLKRASNDGLVAVMLLITVAATTGCDAESGTATAKASFGRGDDASSWCASAAWKHPGFSLKYSVTSTLAGVQAWRAEQGRSGGLAGGFEEQVGRFPVLASLAPTDPLGVCLFVHAPRPVSQPPGANITTDGTRAFVTPDGTYVEDAIGSQAGLLKEMSQIR